jgi:hypothetical protein
MRPPVAGAGGAIAHLGLQLAHAQALDFAGLRTVLGALVLFGVLLWRRAPLRPPPLAPTLLLGLLQTTGFVGFTVWALAAGGGAGETAVLVYTMPFWVLLLAWPLLGERLRTTQGWAVMLALTGLGLMLGAGHRPIAWGEQRRARRVRRPVLGGERHRRQAIGSRVRGEPVVPDRLADAVGGSTTAIVSLRAMRDHRRISPPLAQE